MVIRVPSVPSEHTATFLAKRLKVPLVRTSAHLAKVGIALGNPPKLPLAKHVEWGNIRPAPAIPSVNRAPSEHLATFLAKRLKVPLVRTSAHLAKVGIALGNPPKLPLAKHVEQGNTQPAPGSPSVNPARPARPPTPWAPKRPRRANLARPARPPLAPLPQSAHRAQRGNMWPAPASPSVNPARPARPPTPSAPKRPRRAHRAQRGNTRSAPASPSANCARPVHSPLVLLPRSALRAQRGSIQPAPASLSVHLARPARPLAPSAPKRP